MVKDSNCLPVGLHKANWIDLFQKSKEENLYRYIEMTDDAARALSWHCSIVWLKKMLLTKQNYSLQATVFMSDQL